MKKLVQAFVFTAAVAATALAPMASASAQDRGWRDYNRSEWRDYRGGRDYYRRDHRRPVIVERRSNSDAVALGVLGLAAGAIVGGAIADSRANQRVYIDPPTPTYYPAPTYYPPAPAYAQPVIVRGGLEPWSPSWYRYCENRYRSFNHNTGTFRGYDGRDHFCVAN